MVRRAFLACSGLAAFAQSPPAPPAAKIRSSVALWLLPGSLDERLAAVARAGIQAVELRSVDVARLSPAEGAQAKRSLRSYGLAVDAIVATAAGGGDMLEIARRWEAQSVLIPGGEGAASAAGLRRVGDLAAKDGVTLLVGDPGLAKAADHQYVRLIFDTAAAQERVGDATKAFEPVASLVKLIHVADSPGRREPGSGSIAFAPFYQAVAKLGFSGHIAMAYEFSNRSAAAASLMRSVDSMRRNLTLAPPPTP